MFEILTVCFTTFLDMEGINVSVVTTNDADFVSNSNAKLLSSIQTEMAPKLKGILFNDKNRFYNHLNAKKKSSI